MSQADELLDSLAEPEVVTYSVDPNTEPHIVVNADRTVTVPEELKHIAVQGEHNIETVTFDCPRYWDGHDLSQMIMRIVFRRPDGHSEPHLVENLRVDDADTNTIHFDWTISGNVTLVKGSISFTVCAKLSNAEGVREREWHTRLNQDLVIDEGLECSGEEIVEQNPDIIEAILVQLDDLKNSGGVSDEQVANAVEIYMAEHPVEGGIDEQEVRDIVDEYLAENPPASNPDSGENQDYAALTNKPKINGVELSGNKTAAELGIDGTTDEQVSSAVNAWLNDHPEATSTVENNSLDIGKFTEVGGYFDYGAHGPRKPFAVNSNGVHADGECVYIPVKVGETYSVRVEAGYDTALEFSHRYAVGFDTSGAKIWSKAIADSYWVRYTPDQDGYLAVTLAYNGASTIVHIYKDTFNRNSYSANAHPSYLDGLFGLPIKPHPEHDAYMQERIQQINHKLNFKGYITDEQLEWLTDAEKYDCYIYIGSKPHVIYDDVIEIGDLCWSLGDNARWKKIKLPNPVELQLNAVTHCDICIVGGGAAGVAAAYALKDSGYHVVLVEQLSSLGGTHTNAGVLQLLASPAPDFLRDICEEAVTEGYAKWHTSNHSIGSDEESAFTKLWRGGSVNTSKTNSQWGNALNTNPWYMSKRYYTDLAPTIDVRCNRKFVEAQETDGVIESITCEHLLAGGKETIYAHYFIDCSADGVLARNGKELDEDFYIGSDAKALYNEAALPEGFVGSHYDINSLEPSYLYRAVKADNVESYAKPDFRPVDGVTGHKNNAWKIPLIANCKQWDGNAGVDYHQISATVVSPDHYAKLTAADYVDRGYDYTYAKGTNNAKAHFAVNFNVGAQTLYMGIMPLLAMRETYRVKCDRMLMQSDVETPATSANMAEGHYIALSSWYADFHGSTGVNTGSIAFPGVFGIPYECTIPVDRKNMLIACRGFGASHIAASAARLTKTMMSLGWAAGKAIAQARAGWLDDMRNVDVAQLQADCGVLDQMADIEQYFTFGE